MFFSSETILFVQASYHFYPNMPVPEFPRVRSTLNHYPYYHPFLDMFCFTKFSANLASFLTKFGMGTNKFEVPPVVSNCSPTNPLTHSTICFRYCIEFHSNVYSTISLRNRPKCRPRSSKTSPRRWWTTSPTTWRISATGKFTMLEGIDQRVPRSSRYRLRT